MLPPIQNSSSPPSPQEIKAGRLCLSLLAEKNVIHLDSVNFDLPVKILFPDENSRQAAGPLVGRLKPVFDLSPHQLLSSDLDFLERQLKGISSDKTCREAFEFKLISMALENPDCPTLILLHKIFHHHSISDQDWKSLPHEIKQFHNLLCLIGDVKIEKLFPNFPVLKDEWTSDQLNRAWELWISYFNGAMSCQKTLYKNMTQIALDQLSAKRLHAAVKSDSSIFRKIPKDILSGLFWEGPRSFLLKYEQLDRFEKRLSTIGRQVQLFKNDPVLCQAAIFDCLNSTLGLITEISTIAQSMEQRFLAYQETGERKVCPDKNLKLLGDASRIREAHQETIDTWHAVFLNTSVLSLFSRFFCQIVRKSLCLDESKGRKLLPRSEAALRAKITYHSLDLEDFDDAPPSKTPSIKAPSSTLVFNEEDKREEEKQSTQTSLPTDRTPPDLFLEQLGKDLETESILPYAATLAEWMQKETGQKEIGDHLFFMLQGLDLFADCVQKGNPSLLAPIFRAIMIDCHVLLEKHFIHRIGSNPFIHDLSLLGQMSRTPLSETQKDFLSKARLLTYWARYPACSEAYFEENPPLFLQILTDLTNHLFYPKISINLHSLLTNTLELVLPKQLLLKPFMERLDSLTKYLPAKPPQEEGKEKRFRFLKHTIKEAIRTYKKTDKTEHLEAISHLQELTYYLSWLETGITLQKNHRAPLFEFWHERNRLEIDKLFKHLYAAECLLHGRGDPRKHQLSYIFEILDEIRRIDPATKAFLRSFNMGIALQYHSQKSPIKNYNELATECIQQAHDFSTQTNQVSLWSDFDKALELFKSELSFTLGFLNKNS